MSLLHKTNSVLNFFKPIDLIELSDRYTNLNTYEYKNINYSSRKETSNINNFNLVKECYNSESKNNRYQNELSEINIKKANEIKNNLQNISFKKKIISKNSNNNKINSKNKEKKIGYINEKYIKMLEENKKLKDKLNSKEYNNKEQLNNLIVENSKLKYEIENLNNLNEEFKLKINEKDKIIEKLNNDINNINIQISELTEENKNLKNNINNLKITIKNLSKDKNILISEISELNKSLTNKIKPKLIKNENYLLSLEEQFNLLKKENDTLIENDLRQKLLIKNFEIKNKIKKQKSRKNNISNNITQYKSKSTEDLNINNSAFYTHKSYINNKIVNEHSKSYKKSTSKGTNKSSKKIKKSKNKFKVNNIKRKGKLKKALSQKNIKFENISKDINDININLNNYHKKKSIKTKEKLDINSTPDIININKTKFLYNKTTTLKNNADNILKDYKILYKPKLITKNKMPNEESKESEVKIKMKINKENTGSLLSSFNEEIKY